DFAAQLGRHRLLAITNSEDRNARLVNRLWRQRGILIEDRGGSARQGESLRPHLTGSSLGLLGKNNLGIDRLLPDPARDELGDLGTEIDDQNLVVHGRRYGPNVSGIGAKRPFGATFCGLWVVGSRLPTFPVTQSLPATCLESAPIRFLHSLE